MSAFYTFSDYMRLLDDCNDAAALEKLKEQLRYDIVFMPDKYALRLTKLISDKLDYYRAEES